MKKLLIAILIILPLTSSAVWYNPLTWFEKSSPELSVGGPSVGTVQYVPTLLPLNDNQWDLGTSTKVFRNIFMYNSAGTTRCLQITSAGLIQIANAACGSGGGGGGSGTFSTTTLGGQIIQYPYTPLITSLDSDSTTTSAVYFDPINQKYQIGNTNTASTTLMGNVYFPTKSQGFAYLGSNSLLSTVASSSILLQDLGGAVTDAQVPDSITVTLAGTATALAANGANCSAGSFPLGVDASGAVESCAAVSISGITNGNNLADLTATDSSLTFSGAYNGGTARTVGLNVGNANTWTVNQTFNYSSSTIYSSFLTASSTFQNIGTLTFGGVTGSAWSSFCTSITGGAGLCDGSDDGGSGGADFTYNTDIGYGVTGSATTTKTQFTLGLHASGTSHFSNATSTLFTAVTGWFTNIFVGADTLAEYISDTAGAFFTGNTETGITVTYQDADNTVDVVCNTADTSTFGCLTDTDWDTFNNKAGLAANTFTGLQTFPYSSSTIYSSFIHASTTTFTLGGVTGSAWADFCVSITGSAGLCDGDDASGVGGSSAYETATTSDIAVSQVAYISKTGGRTTLASAATSTLGVASSLLSSGTLGYQVGGTNSSLSINTANSNTWSVLQTFNYSSSTAYSSFNVASTTNFIIGGDNFNDLTGTGLAISGNSLTSTLGTSIATTEIVGGSTNTSLVTNGADVVAWAKIDLANMVTGTLPIANGGTATTTGRYQGIYFFGGDVFRQASTTGLLDYDPTRQLFTTKYSSSTAYSSFNVASSTRLLAGDIGIGTSSPQALLHVGNEFLSNAAGLTSPRAYFATDQNSRGGILMKNINTGSSADFRFIISGDNDDYVAFSHGGSANTTTLFGIPRGQSSQIFTFSPDGTRHLSLGTFSVGDDVILGTSDKERMRISDAGIGIGTSTPVHTLTVSSSTAPQLSLSAGAGIAQWTMRNAGGNLYFSTTTVVGTATTSTSALSLLNTGEVIVRNLFQIFNVAGTKIMDVAGSAVTLLGTWDFSGATVKIHTYPAFTYATSTAWSGTTTIPLAPAYTAESFAGVKCFTDTGTLNVSFNDGTNRMNMLNASTTVGSFVFSTNNTFTAGEKRYVDIGTPASSPTKISCSVDRIVNN